MSSWSKVPVTSATVWYNDNNAGNNKYADMRRSGSSGVAHAVSSLGGKGFQNYAFKAAKCIATNYKTFPDTHGSAILGMGWTALGATVDKASFRSPMNNYIWYFHWPIAQMVPSTFNRIVIQMLRTTTQIHV